MNKFRVVARYPGGINREYDTQLFEKAKYVLGGTGIGGGGCDLRTGTRENDWGVDSYQEAELLKTMLLQSKIRGLEVEIQ